MKISNVLAVGLAAMVGFSLQADAQEKKVTLEARAVKKAKEFVATPEGQAFAQKIKNGEGLSQMGIGKAQQDNIKKELSQNPGLAKTIFDILNGKG